MNRSNIIRYLILAISLALTTFAYATPVNDPSNGEPHLYEIWNNIFSDSMTSSQDLFDTYGVPDGEDYYWMESSGSINLSVRYAGYSQSLGVSVDGVDTVVLPDISKGYTYGTTTFDVEDGKTFRWFELFNEGKKNEGIWYSDNSDGLDHFIALQVPQQLFGGWQFEQDVYLLAFEDLTLGDMDYNDLVVLVDGVHLPPPVPEPATITLMAAGIAGLYGLRKRVLQGNR
jgi:hypothetical protein